MADLGNLAFTISVKDVPEVLWQLRREVSTILREEASAEADPRIARRLVEIAIAFESGQRGNSHG